MKLNGYLTFDGRCQEAFELYAKVLGARLDDMRTHVDAPTGVAPEWRDKILHAQLAIGSDILMGSDRPPGSYQRAQGFHVSLVVDSVAEAERVFGALAEGGTIGMPLAETFWTARFGTLVDRFGTPWMIQTAQRKL